VFTEAADGSLRFHPAPPPTDAEVGRLLATIRTRILRLLRRRGILGEPEEGDAPDPLAETSLALAGVASAAVQGRTALGSRAGACRWHGSRSTPGWDQDQMWEPL